MQWIRGSDPIGVECTRQMSQHCHRLSAIRSSMYGLVYPQSNAPSPLAILFSTFSIAQLTWRVPLIYLYVNERIFTLHNLINHYSRETRQANERERILHRQAFKSDGCRHRRLDGWHGAWHGMRKCEMWTGTLDPDDDHNTNTPRRKCSRRRHCCVTANDDQSGSFRVYFLKTLFKSQRNTQKMSLSPSAPPSDWEWGRQWVNFSKLNGRNFAT